MDIFVVGLSHKTAPVAVREKVAFAPEKMQTPLEQLLALPGIAEAVIVSTCNRVELYAAGPDALVGINQLKRFMAAYHQLDEGDLEEHLYSHSGDDAISPCLQSGFKS